MSDEIRDPADDYVAEVSENPHHDNIDIAEVLQREEEGGKGGAAIPAENFVAYADPTCDKEDDN